MSERPLPGEQENTPRHKHACELGIRDPGYICTKRGFCLCKCGAISLSKCSQDDDWTTPSPAASPSAPHVPTGSATTSEVLTPQKLVIDPEATGEPTADTPEKLRADFEHWKANEQVACDARHALDAEKIASLESDLASARSDTERLNWLSQYGKISANPRAEYGDDDWLKVVSDWDHEEDDNRSLRAAIDSARSDSLKEAKP